MIRNSLLFGFLLTLTVVNGQVESDLYKQNPVVLKADANFGFNNNWEDIFSDYRSTYNNKFVGEMKKIVVAPDGRIYMSHRTRHTISIFNKEGEYMYEFGKNSSKEEVVDLMYKPSIQGIIDNMLYTVDMNGRMLFFNLDGTFIKLIKLDFMPLHTVPLKDGKVAIQGHIRSKGGGDRKIITIKDIDTGDENIISSESESFFNNGTTYAFMHPQELMPWSEPFSHPIYTRDRMERTIGGELIVASPVTGEVRLFSEKGEALRNFKLKIVPQKISEAKKEAYYQQALKIFERVQKNYDESLKLGRITQTMYESAINFYKEAIEVFKDPEFMPDFMPLFSSMIVDANNNLLVFEYTPEEGSNKFQVYTFDASGQHTATSSFSSDTYQLDITSSKMVFHDQSLIAVVKEKGVEKVPLRLVKFDL